MNKKLLKLLNVVITTSVIFNLTTFIACGRTWYDILFRYFYAEAYLLYECVTVGFIIGVITILIIIKINKKIDG